MPLDLIARETSFISIKATKVLPEPVSNTAIVFLLLATSNTSSWYLKGKPQTHKWKYAVIHYSHQNPKCNTYICNINIIKFKYQNSKKEGQTNKIENDKKKKKIYKIYIWTVPNKIRQKRWHLLGSIGEWESSALSSLRPSWFWIWFWLSPDESMLKFLTRMMQSFNFCSC